VRSLDEVLTTRLADMGLTHAESHAFLKDVAAAVSANPRIGLGELNRQLHSLGRHTIDLVLTSLKRLQRR